jgi:hypothetical protein
MSNGNNGGGEGADPDADLIVEPVKNGEQVNWEERAKKLEERAAKQRERTAELRGKIKERDAADAKAAADKKAAEDAKGDKPKPGELDRVDRAVLRTEKITDAKEIELVQSWMKDTGKTVEQILENKHFLNDLKDLRELEASDDATPEGKKRAGGSARNTVEYWIAKGELPPASEPELRTKVVNAKMAQKKAVSNFSDKPVA